MRGGGSPSEVHSGGGEGGVGAEPDPGQNWLSGVVLYYQLTGDPKARECALRNYQGIEARAVKWLRTEQSDDIYLYGSFLTMKNLMSLHSMTGEKKYLDDVGTMLSGHLLPRFVKCGPFLFEPRLEIRGQEYHRLGEQFCYGILTLGEYHHRTGDPRVGKVLAEACVAEFPETYFEAPLFLSDLYAYVGSAAFKPSQEFSGEMLEKLFVPKFANKAQELGAKIEIKTLGIGVPDSTDLINHWIVVHDYSSMSSSGVQITGQT
jgi:hypothetical protein